MICAYIMLNLFILIIIQQFEDFHLKEDNPITHFKRNLDSFSKIWAEFTEANYGITIHSKKLIDFYIRLDPPLGFGKEFERPKVALEIMKMNLTGFTNIEHKNKYDLIYIVISDEEGNIYFNELLFASMKRVFGQDLLNNVSKEIKEMMENQEKQIKARLEKRTLKMINSFYAESPATRPRSLATSRNLSPLKSGNKKQTVNPMITIIFVGMVFKSWKRYCEHFKNSELDGNGSVILPEKAQFDEEESSESPQSSSNSEENLDSESQESKKVVENQEKSISSSSNSESDEESEEEVEKDSKKKDKRQLAFNMIGKFMNRKKKAEEQHIQITGDNIPIQRRNHDSNIFRTFFASNEGKGRLDIKK